MIKGLDSFVTLDEKTHTYRDRDGRVYMSVSKFRERFKEPFDRKIAFQIAGKGDYTGMTGEQILQMWDNHRDDRAGKGTRIHNACERYEKSTVILPDDHDLRPMILSIASEYKSYYRVYQEQVVYDTDAMIAGTADKFCLTSSHKDAPIDITDYKTNARGIYVKDLDKHGNPVHKYFLGVLSHLLLSKYSDYALQMSIYAYMLEKQTGRRIGSLRIHFIPTDNPLAHYFIPVPYLKYEVIEMLKWHMENPIVEIIKTQPEAQVVELDWNEY